MLGLLLFHCCMFHCCITTGSLFYLLAIITPTYSPERSGQASRGRDLLKHTTYNNTSSLNGACTDTSVEIEGGYNNIN